MAPRYYDTVTSKRTRICFLLLPLLFLSVPLVNSTESKEEKDKPRPRQLDSKPGDLKEIRVYFHSCSSVQYAGFLMAQHEGYYQANGLPPVKFQWLSAQSPDVDIIGQGQAEFAVSWLPHICALRSEKNDFVVVSRLAQNQSLKLKVRKDLNPDLTSVRSLAGKKLSAPSWAYESSLVYTRAFKVGDTLVERNSNGLVLFRDGYVDALFFTSYEGGVLARFSRHRDALRFFSLDSAGFVLPEDVLVCSKRFLSDHRELCEKFVAATWRGWQEVCKDHEKTLDVLNLFSSSPTYSIDRWITRYQLKAWLEILAYNPLVNGTLKAKDYDEMKTALIKTGVIPEKKMPTFSEFIQILPANGTLQNEQRRTTTFETKRD